ncbi:MAG: ABC transporter substrate-binding protein [Boseongicola sp.]|nr:ABC transporter substrate-binding protein [Boseongicola sp.]
MSNKAKPNVGANITRRRVLKTTLVGAAALATPAYLRPGWAQGKRVVVVNFGGKMGDVKRKAFYDPFTQDTGIEVVTVSPPELAKLKLMVEQGAVEWDLVDLLPAWVGAAKQMDLLQEVDDSIVDRADALPAAKDPLACGVSVSAGGIAYPTDRLQGQQPKTWPEFWDVANHPGRRGLRTRVADTLEIALMADGVAPADVYPCDVERAFKALDRIKPHVSHWIDSTAQTVSLIQSNETDYTFTYTTRVKGMQESGVPMEYSFEQNLLGMVFTAVPKGAPNSDGAMRLLSYIMDPDRQVEMANGSGDAPTYVSSIEKVDADVRKWLPDLSSDNNMVINGDWWAANAAELGPRMKEWLLT